VPVRALRPTFARGLVAAHPGRARLPPERPRARRTCCRPATYLTVPSPTRTPATQGSRLGLAAVLDELARLIGALTREPELHERMPEEMQADSPRRCSASTASSLDPALPGRVPGVLEPGLSGPSGPHPAGGCTNRGISGPPNPEQRFAPSSYNLPTGLRGAVRTGERQRQGR